MVIVEKERGSASPLRSQPTLLLRARDVFWRTRRLSAVTFPSLLAEAGSSWTMTHRSSALPGDNYPEKTNVMLCDLGARRIPSVSGFPMMTGRVSVISRIGEDCWPTRGPGSPPEQHSGTGAHLTLRVTTITLVSVCSLPRPRGHEWRLWRGVRAWGAAWSPHTRAGPGAPGVTCGTGWTLMMRRGLVSAGPVDPHTGGWV